MSTTVFKNENCEFAVKVGRCSCEQVKRGLFGRACIEFGEVGKRGTCEHKISKPKPKVIPAPQTK